MAAARWYRPRNLGDARAPLMVVEASAGTGKTWFLERRVVDLVLNAGATIDQIVVVTFTDKATTELRARVRALLARMVHGEPDAPPAGADPNDVWIVDDDARARLRAALDGFDGAPISTIHGFCQRVLAEESFAARRRFDQVQIPDETALRAAFTAALRDRFALDPDERTLLRAYLEDNGSVDDLFELVLQVYRTGAALAEPGAGSTPAQILVPRMVAEVVRRADHSKRREGQLDFQDMLRLTEAALTGPGGATLARRIAVRHPYALIDEFQDTDPLQWRIFATIWTQPPARGLTVVGDPKQAIYSFRGGDVHTYLTAVGDLTTRGAARVDLAECQRSTVEVIDAVNRILTAPRPVFAGGPGEIGYPHPVRATGRVTAAWADGRPLAPLSVLRFTEFPSAPEFKATVAAAIADEVARLVRDPAHRIVGVRNGARHEVGAGDIMVLTRTNDEAFDVADAIRRRGVPCALARAEHLFATAEARAVADLLDAIAHPRDRARRLRAWMTCFFDVDPDDLGRALDVPDDHVLAARLHDWRGLAVRMDYPRLFAAILADSRVAERALATGRGERTVTNIAHVFEHLHAEVERSKCELPELVSRLRGWIRSAKLDRPDESDAQRQETDREAVQVMTAHRAKGLEAWVVFSAGLVAFSRRTDDVLLFHDGEGLRKVALRTSSDDPVTEAAQLELRAEAARVAYVALTRARARLYLPLLCAKHGAADGKRRPPKSAASGLHGPYAAIHDNLEALCRPDAGGGVAVDEWAPAAALGAPIDLRAVALPPPPAEPTRAAIERAGFIVTSYTRMKQAAHARLGAVAGEIDAAEMTGDDRSRATPAAGDLPGGPATGQLLHEVLEHADVAVAAATDAAGWLARPDVAALFVAAERRHGIDPIHRPRAAALVHRTLTADVVAGPLRLPPLCRADRLAREVEFVFPIPGAPGRGFIKGFIDAIVTWGERWFVVDYKSDVLELGADAAAAHVREHYALQAELYAIACARLMKVRDPADHAARFGGLLYWFLRTQQIVHLAPSADDLRRYEAALATTQLAGGPLA